MPLDRDLYQREMDLARDFANKGGPASVYCHVSTNGAGAFAFQRRIDFGLTFIEEPFMAFGSSIDVDDMEDAGYESVGGSGDPDEGVQMIPLLPTCTGYVTAWDTDDQDNYIGVWVAVQVNYPYVLPSSAPGGAIPIRHYFTFSAVAIKNLSDGDELPATGGEDDT